MQGFHAPLRPCANSHMSQHHAACTRAETSPRHSPGHDKCARLVAVGGVVCADLHHVLGADEVNGLHEHAGDVLGSLRNAGGVHREEEDGALGARGTTCTRAWAKRLEHCMSTHVWFGKAYCTGTCATLHEGGAARSHLGVDCHAVEQRAVLRVAPAIDADGAASIRQARKPRLQRCLDPCLGIVQQLATHRPAMAGNTRHKCKLQPAQRKVKAQPAHQIKGAHCAPPLCQSACAQA